MRVRAARAAERRQAAAACLQLLHSGQQPVDLVLLRAQRALVLRDLQIELGLGCVVVHRLGLRRRRCHGQALRAHKLAAAGLQEGPLAQRTVRLAIAAPPTAVLAADPSHRKAAAARARHLPGLAMRTVRARLGGALAAAVRGRDAGDKEGAARALPHREVMGVGERSCAQMEHGCAAI